MRLTPTPCVFSSVKTRRLLRLKTATTARCQPGFQLPIRLFLISDYCLLAQGIVQLLASQPERFFLVGLAPSPAQAEAALALAAVDVLLLDINGSPDQPPALIQQVKQHCSAKILLLTRHDDSSLPYRIAAMGASGLVDRHTSPELLLRALEKVHEGQLWLDRAATGRILTARASHNAPPGDPIGAQLKLLTEREQKILATLINHSGEPGKSIAQRLHISESTLRNHLTTLYEKFDVPNRNGLLAYALQTSLSARLEPAVSAAAAVRAAPG